MAHYPTSMDRIYILTLSMNEVTFLFVTRYQSHCCLSNSFSIAASGALQQPLILHLKTSGSLYHPASGNLQQPPIRCIWNFLAASKPLPLSWAFYLHLRHCRRHCSLPARRRSLHHCRSATVLPSSSPAMPLLSPSPPVTWRGQSALVP